MTSRYRLALISIGAYTFVPLGGVLFFGWDWREVMIFYWLGNISVGLSVVIGMIKSPRSAWEKMIAPTKNAGSNPPLTEAQTVIMMKAYKVFLVPFFCLHYGLFTLVHGVFVFAIVNGSFGVDTVRSMPAIDYGSILLVWLVGAAATLLVEAASPANRVSSIARLWGSAYGRIIALHISIILGAFLIQALHLPAIAAVLLILINFAIQLLQIKLSTASALSKPADT